MLRFWYGRSTNYISENSRNIFKSANVTKNNIFQNHKLGVVFVFIALFILILNIIILGSVKLPKTIRMRFLVIFWTIFSLLVATIYQSKLVAILMKPMYEHQISNVREMLDFPLKIIFIHDYTEVSSLIVFKSSVVNQETHGHQYHSI